MKSQEPARDRTFDVCVQVASTGVVESRHVTVAAIDAEDAAAIVYDWAAQMYRKPDFYIGAVQEVPEGAR